jgi:hypothetical protein
MRGMVLFTRPPLNFMLPITAETVEKPQKSVFIASKCLILL